MTRIFSEKHLVQEASNSSLKRSTLRLVSTSYSTDGTSNICLERSAVPCLVLKSAIGDKNIANEFELVDLFQSLRSGERIEVSHTLHRDAFGNIPVGLPYSLRISVAAEANRVEELKARVTNTFASAFPGFHFVPGGAPSSAELKHVSQFVLSGVVATEKPAPSKFAPEWNQSTALAGFMNFDKGSARQTLPFAEDLPNWAYSAPFTGPLNLPAGVEISIRIHGFALGSEFCESLHRTLFRIQSGNFVIFHPESPIAAYSSSSHLQDQTADLIRHWLQHPSGFAVDCVVKSSDVLSEAAQKRIISDVFGKRPFHCAHSFVNLTPKALAGPEFSWAIARGQGLPAMLPAQSVLSRLAVPRHYSAPLVRPPNTGSLIGSTVCGSRSSAVRLPFAGRSRHTAVFGATGSGKSSLFAQMMISDMADSDQRCGLGLIDPHGELCEQVLQMVPAERKDDVILVDTSDLSSTACLNPLEGMKDDPIHANFVVSELMSLIDHLFEGENTSGPMTRNNLRNLLLLSSSVPQRHSTILDAVRVMEDIGYADYLLSKCQDRNVKEYWQNFRKTRSSDSGYSEWGTYLMARLAPFVSTPIMKRLINRPDSTIDLAQAMREKKIVIFNLNRGVLNDNECTVLGSLILSKFFAATLGRAKLPEDQRPPFHLYVDEFALFANDSTPRLFSEARKFNLCLNVAFQSLSQLENRWGRSNVATSVLANTATKFIMRLGPADASVLEPFYAPQFDAAAMTSLPDFHAVACMTDNNRPIPPFVLKTHLATPDLAKHAAVNDIKLRSRQKYGVPTDQANQELSKLYELDISTLASKQSQPMELAPISAAGGYQQKTAAPNAYLVAKARI